uniref:Ephexin-1 n=1 Tax=Sipha flava TaxID=143950 RepID=A0A2S2R034_9HEMI
MPSSSYYCNSQTLPPPLPPARTQRRRKSLFVDKVSISSQSVISFIKDVPEQLISKKNKCDYLNEQLLNVVLKTVFLEEKFESQELSLYFDNEIKEKTNTISQEIPEEIYADYDSFESDDSWDDCKDGVNIKRVPYPCENRDLPAPPSQQNIYGLVPLVKKAGNRMKKRWSFGSLGLNRIRKLSVGHLATDFGNKTYGSTSDKSTENKFNPSAKRNSLSSSIFYLNDSIYNNIENGQIRAPVRNASKPPSSVDSRRLSVARPSSPPPPPPPLPPPVKRHSTGSNAYDGSLPRSISNSKGRPVLDKSNTVESVSENGSNHGSDLYMRFADEPLYQFYAADISERTKSVFAGDMMEECDGYEEISSITSRPSALELITPCPSGHGQHRSLWCEVPEVKNSGIIDTLKPRERKLQEAKFELITSEASYFKSLTVLEKHFVNSYSMNDETILSKNDRKILFGNVNPVRKCSEKLLAALEKCWQDNILLKGLCEILYTHSKENFEVFVRYCSNQIYIDRTLKTLREKNFKFNEALHRLESDTKCQSLSLHSFLMLPMQRITRLPLLVDAILSQMDSSDNSLEYQMCELTLASLNSIVQNCNESTRKLERYEEMLLLSRQLEFSSKKEIKAMSVASSSRWLVRSGSMLHLTSPDAKLTFSRKLIRPTKLYFFLFNDMFFIAKRKSDESYTVVDYCARNFVQMVDATELVITSSYKNLLMLTILENHEAKTIEMLLSCDSESSKKRWIEAMSPPISSNPDETLYNEWDCPQVYSEHPYTAVQPDELSLQSGDIVKVLTKMNDGWYHGERIRDGEKGWFPGNYTSEIASQHARAKNLKQRYRLLAMSGSYLQSQQDKIKKK